MRSCSVDRPIHLIGGHGPACGIEKCGRLGPRWEMQLAIDFPISDASGGSLLPSERETAFLSYSLSEVGQPVVRFKGSVHHNRIP